MSISEITHPENITALISDLIQTDRAPSSSQDALIRSTYWQTRSNISRIDDAISDLLRRRAALRHYAHNLGALLSPIRRIPPELLGEIFYHCLPSNYVKKNAKKAVMLPSHICRHWRNVALSTPRLWTKIVLYINDQNMESSVALVNAWLSRSGSCSLSLVLTIVGRNVQLIIDAVLPYCDRWQHISLNMPWGISQCFERAEGRLQRLETLSIRNWGGSLSSQNLFESALNLRKLTLSGLTRSLNFQWAQLAECDLGLCGIAECLEVLQCTQKLQKLRITLKQHNMDMGTLRPFVLKLCGLVSLHVEAEAKVRAFFDHLCLPGLRDFVFEEHGLDDEWAQAEFISLISRSSCHLQGLDLSFGCLTADAIGDNLIQILQHTPSLVSLTLNYFNCDVCLTSTLLDRLSARMLENGQIDCLIPRLKTIRIQTDEDVNLDCEAFTNMIKSRSRWRLGRAMNGVDSGSRADIAHIQTVQIICFDVGCVNGLLEGLAPLRGLVRDVSVDTGDDTYWLPAYPTAS